MGASLSQSDYVGNTNTSTTTPAAVPAAYPHPATEPNTTTCNSNATTPPGGDADSMCQQLNAALSALPLDWQTVDQEMEMVTGHLAATLLTCRLRSQSAGRVPGALLCSPHVCEGNVEDYSEGSGANQYDDTDCIAGAGETLADLEEAAAGAQELYVSAALRLAALNIGPVGLHRIVLALAYLANGGETLEERRLRKNSSHNTHSSAAHATKAPQGVSHHQRGARIAGSATSTVATVVNCPSFTEVPATSTGFASAPHPHRNAFGTLVGRKLSTVMQAHQPSVQHYSFSMPVLIGSRAPVHGGSSTSTSLDQPAQAMSVDRSPGRHQHLEAPKAPASCSYDDTPLISERGAIAAPRPQRMRCSCSPFGVELGDTLMRPRPEGDTSSSTTYSRGDPSYNNGLLCLMNARSTMASVLRGGMHGELPLSSSSNPTLMSASIATGILAPVRTPREDHLAGQHSANSSSNAGRSPMMAPLYTAAQGMTPPAPSTVISAVATNSLSSCVAHYGITETRKRPDLFVRRSGSALHTYVVGGKTLSAAGRIHQSEIPGEDLLSTAGTVSHHLTLEPDRGVWETSAPRLPSSVSCQDTPLRLLPPEAVLVALCSIFAHLHLSSDDVTNLTTLLVVSALQVQIEVQLRCLAVAPSDGLSTADVLLHAANFNTPSSVAQIRSAVVECLQLGFYPLYDRLRSMLNAASGVADEDLSSPTVNTTRSEVWRPSRPPTSLTPSQRPLSASPAGKMSTLYESHGDAEHMYSGIASKDSKANLSVRVQAIHDFFTEYIPIECAPPLRGAAAMPDIIPQPMAAVPLDSVGRKQRPQHTPPPLQQQPALANESPCAYPPSSDSAVGLIPLAPLSCSSAPGASTVAAAAAATNSHVATRTPGTSGASRTLASASHACTSRGTPNLVLRSSQASVRSASSYLMDLETTFVLHYAEAIPDEYKPDASDSSAAGAGATAAAKSAASCRCGCRCDADPDILVHFSPDATVWPLRTRLLVRRHNYMYIYGAVASTVALLHQDDLYTQEKTLDSSYPGTQGQPHVSHLHTPITIIDLNRAAAQKDLDRVQVVSGPGDVEAVNLMPSRVSHATVRCRGCRCITAFAPRGGKSRSSPPGGQKKSAADASAQGRGSAPNLLDACSADSGNCSVEVYRMKGSTGTMYLLSLPVVENALSDVATAPPQNKPRLSTGSLAVTGDTAGGVDDASPQAAISSGGATEASVLSRFERHPLLRRARSRLTSTTVSAPNAERAGGADESLHRRKAEITSAETAAAATSASLSIQCDSCDGVGETLTLRLGNEPSCTAAYPLRIIYRGVLHHFFFANPSTRDKWHQKLVQLSGMMQSQAYMHKVASAPHDVEQYLRNRFSFLAGPGAFECLDVLGVGTFGRVLLVQHKLSKRLFAMKVIRKSGFHGVRNIIEARREKKILDMLDCPYIMKIYNSFQTDNRVYMLFDYLPGAELLLHTHSAHRHHFDEATSRFYIAELAVAVEYLRVRGIVHRDIKGDNIVLDSEGHIVLTDFGFAKNILAEPPHPNHSPQVIRQHTSCGTLAYIAPEVLNNARRRSGYGLEVDWWSLGVVLFTFLTGYFPFSKQTGQETSNAILNNVLQFPPRPTLSEEARSLLQQLLHKDPAARISSLANLRQHPFFSGFDWAACCERRLPPPLVLHKDSYRSPSSAAEARKLLQDRVRRSLAWSAGTSPLPYEPPSHSRRPPSDSLSIKFQALLEEEKEVLHLVAEAHGAQSIPKPLLESNDVFGPLFEQQEHCGSHREESDIEDLRLEDYAEGFSQLIMEQMKLLKDGGVMREPHSPLSNLSLSSGCQEYSSNAGILSDENTPQQRSSAALMSSIMAGLDVPLLADFTEAMYADVALAKYAGGDSGNGVAH